MPESAQQTVVNSFQLVAGEPARVTWTDLIRGLLPASLTELPEALSETAREVSALRGASEAQSQAVSVNTDAVWENTASQSGSGAAGAARTVGRVVSTVFSSALGMVPLASAVAGLFRSKEPEAEAIPLVRYAWPPAVRFEGELRAGGRAQESGSADVSWPRPAEAEARPWLPPQITVQVQAMDSRSFLDHSPEIARAVREAMLHMHALNDVVSDL
jgi:hypothetical protein